MRDWEMDKQQGSVKIHEWVHPCIWWVINDTRTDFCHNSAKYWSSWDLWR